MASHNCYPVGMWGGGGASCDLQKHGDVLWIGPGWLIVKIKSSQDDTIDICILLPSTMIQWIWIYTS